MIYLVFQSIESTTFKVGYALGYFIAGFWPFIIGIVAALFIYYFLSKRQSNI